MPVQGNDTSGVELDKLIEESYARKAEAEDVFSRHDSDESGTIDSKELKAVLEELAKEEGLNDEDVQQYTSSGRDKKVRPTQDSATSADPHGAGHQSLKCARVQSVSTVNCSVAAVEDF